MLEKAGQVVTHTQPPPKPEFFKVPGALLNVTREWAEAMGLDPDKLEPA